MRDLLKTLLGAGITVGLADREAFVSQVAEFIKEYQQDPEKAQKWAAGVIAYLENVRNNINIEQAVKGGMEGSSLPGKAEVEELTQAIKKLTAELQNQQRK